MLCPAVPFDSHLRKCMTLHGETFNVYGMVAMLLSIRRLINVVERAVLPCNPVCVDVLMIVAICFLFLRFILGRDAASDIKAVAVPRRVLCCNNSTCGIVDMRARLVAMQYVVPRLRDR
jgi:hypothetical protein